MKKQFWAYAVLAMWAFYVGINYGKIQGKKEENFDRERWNRKLQECQALITHKGK